MIRRLASKSSTFARQLSTSAMNRPRNRQPRLQHNRPQRERVDRGGHAQTSADMPTTRQVVPGSAVSIVLKAEQSTGREVQGFVKDLLTRGDHPRGIKVRLQDGRIGRVQRMIGASSLEFQSNTTAQSSHPRSRQSNPTGDLSENNAQELRSRSLADFVPSVDDSGSTDNAQCGKFEDLVATAKCPFCDSFEGDEAAVSHHVSEHLT